MLFHHGRRLSRFSCADDVENLLVMAVVFRNHAFVKGQVPHSRPLVLIANIPHLGNDPDQ